MILVTGAGGLLGRALVRNGGVAVRGLTRDELDLADPAAVEACLEALRPRVVINLAAWTDVEGAEVDPAGAFALNERAAIELHATCATCEIPMIHVSTDHVFDGEADRPYVEDDAVGPVNVYGASKLAGERGVLAGGATVVRTSWLFDAGQTRGLVPAVFAAARSGRPLRVVDDRHGCPTYAGDLAAALLALAARPPGGLWHYAGDGETTWFGFARALCDALGLTVDLAPIPASDWPERARRPRRTVLDTTRIRALGVPASTPRPWRDALQFLSR